MRKFRRITTDQIAIVGMTVDQLRRTIEHLEFAMRREIIDDVREPLIGDTTRQAIERLNVVRNEWGFDDVEEGETANIRDTEQG